MPRTSMLWNSRWALVLGVSACDRYYGRWSRKVSGCLCKMFVRSAWKIPTEGKVELEPSEKEALRWPKDGLQNNPLGGWVV